MSRPVAGFGRDDHQAALRDLVAAIAGVAAPPWPEIGPDPDANARNMEDFRDQLVVIVAGAPPGTSLSNWHAATWGD